MTVDAANTAEANNEGNGGEWETSGWLASRNATAAHQKATRKTFNLQSKEGDRTHVFFLHNLVQQICLIVS